MKMTKTLALIGALASGISATAIPITGSIDMSGSVLLDNAFLGSADAALAFGPSTVGGIPTGAYAGTFGDSVAWTPFGWDPSTAPVLPLWSFFDGGTGWTYSFSLTSVSVAFQSNSFLNLLGSGVLDITGGDPFDPTPGDWSFTISNPGGGKHANFAFTFANSQTAAEVPDGGATAMLLGVGLVAIGALRRKA
jgi:hypothetical protein